MMAKTRPLLRIDGHAGGPPLSSAPSGLVGAYPRVERLYTPQMGRRAALRREGSLAHVTEVIS